MDMDMDAEQATGHPVADSDPTFETKRGRLPPEERRDELLTAALAVFSELGFEQATLNDVSDRVGVTKGCLYHYFESKEKLLIELVRDRKATHLADAELAYNSTTGTPEQRLEGLLRRMWQGLQDPGQIELALLMMTQMSRLPELRKVMVEEVIAQKQEKLQQVLSQTTQGDTNAQDLAAAASVIPCMILGVALCQHLFRGSEKNAEMMERLGESVTRILLHGVSGGGAPDQT